jgi:hypothetical protein
LEKYENIIPVLNSEALRFLLNIPVLKKIQSKFDLNEHFSPFLKIQGIQIPTSYSNHFEHKSM